VRVLGPCRLRPPKNSRRDGWRLPKHPERGASYGYAVPAYVIRARALHMPRLPPTTPHRLWPTTPRRQPMPCRLATRAGRPWNLTSGFLGGADQGGIKIQILCPLLCVAQGVLEQAVPSAAETPAGRSQPNCPAKAASPQSSPGIPGTARRRHADARIEDRWRARRRCRP